MKCVVMTTSIGGILPARVRKLAERADPVDQTEGLKCIERNDPSLDMKSFGR